MQLLTGGVGYGVPEASGKAVECRLLGDVGKMHWLGSGDLRLNPLAGRDHCGMA